MALPKDFKLDEGLYLVSKLKSGQKTKFRVLSDFIAGRSVWGDPKNTGKRICTRVRSNEPMPAEAIGWNERQDKPERVKQFLAAAVWNYDSNQVEIFETDKWSIISQIFEIEGNDDWGDVKAFDLSLSKKGEGLETEYTLLPLPSKEKVTASWSHVHLDSLYEGKDPFETKES